MACCLGNEICLIKVQLPYTVWLENNETKKKMKNTILELIWPNKSYPMGGNRFSSSPLIEQNIFRLFQNCLQNRFMSQIPKSTSLLYYHTSFWTQKNITQPDPPLNLSELAQAISKNTVCSFIGQLNIFIHLFIHSMMEA